MYAYVPLSEGQRLPYGSHFYQPDLHKWVSSLPRLHSETPCISKWVNIFEIIGLSKALETKSHIVERNNKNDLPPKNPREYKIIWEHFAGQQIFTKYSLVARCEFGHMNRILTVTVSLVSWRLTSRGSRRNTTKKIKIYPYHVCWQEVLWWKISGKGNINAFIRQQETVIGSLGEVSGKRLNTWRDEGLSHALDWKNS